MKRTAKDYLSEKAKIGGFVGEISNRLIDVRLGRAEGVGILMFGIAVLKHYKIDRAVFMELAATLFDDAVTIGETKADQAPS